MSEKIATNILSNRLELLIKNGLLKVTNLPNDQKTKIYYLTDAGIDMYPIIYELMRWSDRNLIKKFGPVGIELLNSFQKKSAQKVISDKTNNYRSNREKILSNIL